MDEGDDFDYNGLDGVVFDEEEAGSLGPLNKALKSRRPARCTSSATARSSCGAGTIFSCALAVASAKFSEGTLRINLEHLLEWGLLNVRCRERGPITTQYRQNPYLRETVPLTIHSFPGNPLFILVCSPPDPASSHSSVRKIAIEKTSATCRPVGRPRNAEPCTCYGGGGGGGGASSSLGAGRHTPHYYHTTIVNSGGLHFHKWRVVVDFEGEKCVGSIVSYRDDYHEERRPYTSVQDPPYAAVESPLLRRRRRRVRGIRCRGARKAPQTGTWRGCPRPGP